MGILILEFSIRKAFLADWISVEFQLTKLAGHIESYIETIMLAEVLSFQIVNQPFLFLSFFFQI